MPTSKGFKLPLLTGGEALALTSRKITEKTCEKWGYLVGEYKDNPCHIANYRDTTGRIVAQKLRLEGKKFIWTGDKASAGLFGKHLWREKSKMVVITEGEIDALTVSQLQDNKWPVVSVQDGAQSAAKSVAADIEWLESFESVIFMFDGDEPGQRAVLDCVALLSPGKAKIAKLPLKDASEMLQADRGREVIDAIWSASPWRPDEIVAGADLWPVITAKDPHIQVPYPWQGLTQKLRGLRQKEITTLCAGSGIGKSTVCREIAHWLIKEQNQTVGYIALEESVKRSALGIMSLEMGEALHLTETSALDQKKLRKAYDSTVGSGRYFSYDHFGSLEAENLFSRIRFLVTGCGCQWIFLDHLSIVVSGMGEGEGDERRLIDNLMTKLRSLVEQLGCGLILVSHLKETEGSSLEEGGKTHLNLLRGSRSIGQLSDIVIGFERNQQDPEKRQITTVRILKDRWTGETGVACDLKYDPETCRLTETKATSNPFEEEESKPTKKPKF